MLEKKPELSEAWPVPAGYSISRRAVEIIKQFVAKAKRLQEQARPQGARTRIRGKQPPTKATDKGADIIETKTGVQEANRRGNDPNFGGPKP